MVEWVGTWDETGGTADGFRSLTDKINPVVSHILKSQDSNTDNNEELEEGVNMTGKTSQAIIPT